jgi:hypothetical protein
MFNQSNTEYFDTIDDRWAQVESTDQLTLEMTDFFCQVLSTVVLDGVVSVTDLAGRVASSNNNYLMAPDGSQFAGVFTTAAGDRAEFTIFEKANGAWGVQLPCAQVA